MICRPGARWTVLPDGTPAGKMLYKAFGEQRYGSGTTPTDYRYRGAQRSIPVGDTGQLSQMTDTGLYYYGARWYDFITSLAQNAPEDDRQYVDHMPESPREHGLSQA